MFVLGSIEWELLGWFAGAGCCGLFVLGILGGTGLIIWRSQQKPQTRALPAALPGEGVETARVLSTVVGYRSAEDNGRVRERWGRPIRYTRCTREGAQWSTPAHGTRLEITERDGRVGGIVTGDEKLDRRFYVTVQEAPLAAHLADPDLRERLLNLPWVHVTSTGDTISFADATLEAHRRMGATEDPDSPASLRMHVQLHDHVADVLVLLADRVS